MPPKADIGSSGFVQQRRIVAHQKCIVGYQERVQLSPALAPASSVRGPGSARNANVCIWFPCVLRKYSRRKPPNSAGVHFQGPLIAAGGLSILEVSMTEKLISRRGAFSLLGLGAALGFAVPTTVLMTSDADAQAQPAAPAPATPAPTTPAPSAGTPGMNRRQARRAGRHERREGRREAREMRREGRRNARETRREARRGMYMQSTKPVKQPQ